MWNSVLQRGSYYGSESILTLPTAIYSDTHYELVVSNACCLLWPSFSHSSLGWVLLKKWDNLKLWSCRLRPIPFAPKSGGQSVMVVPPMKVIWLSGSAVDHRDNYLKLCSCRCDRSHFAKIRRTKASWLSLWKKFDWWVSHRQSTFAPMWFSLPELYQSHSGHNYQFSTYPKSPSSGKQFRMFHNTYLLYSQYPVRGCRYRYRLVT
jgi:hypothetical protein